MDNTILGGRVFRLIRDHSPFAFCLPCAAQKLGVSAFDFRNTAHCAGAGRRCGVRRQASSLLQLRERG
jgi:hypothetical protein